MNCIHPGMTRMERTPRLLGAQAAELGIIPEEAEQRTYAPDSPRGNAVAQATGLDPHTIAKGRQELLAHDVLVERRRRPGAGRKLVEKKRRRSSPKSSG